MKFIVSIIIGVINFIKIFDLYGFNVKLGLFGIFWIGVKYDNSMVLFMMVICIIMYVVIINIGSDVSLIED